MEPLLEPGPETLDLEAFVERFGGIYEHSPWIAELTHAAGLGQSHRSPARLAAVMAAIVGAAPRERQLALLRAHPELVGKLAIAGKLTDESKVEQSSAGLDRCSAEEFAEFRELNDRYTRAFGFPFIIAVRCLSRGDILSAFRRRIGSPPETEFQTALSEVHRIALLRLEALARQG